jgi:endonuclease IV
MVYNEMFNEFKKYVGINDNELSNYISENNIDNSDGMHIWFEFVITPYLINIIKNNNVNKIIKSFEFVEQCLKIKNTDITEVIEFSLLEGVVAEIGLKINELYIYFGEETIKSIDCIKKYIQIN